MHQRIENLSIFVIKVGIFLILFTPLIIFSGVSYPNVFPKTIFFRTIVEIIFIFYILLVLYKKKLYLPKLSPLFLSILVFVGILTISSIFGVNFYRSFWGTAERAEGLVTYFHLLLFFVILISVFRKKENWFWLLKSTVFVSFLVGLSVVIEKLRIFNFFNTDPSRPSGVLGNSTFIPGYLIFGIFLALFFALWEKNWWKKVLYGVIFFVNIFVLVLTKTRGGWIGLFSGLAFLFIFLFIFYHKKFLNLRKIILLGILIILLFAFVVVLNQDKPSISENPYFERYLSIFDPNALKSRLVVWQISIQTLPKKPLLGWGLESFNFVYDKYSKTNYLSIHPVGGGFDRAHNKIFGLLTESGVLGLLNYLLIFFLAFYCLFKYKPRRMPETILAPSIFASLLIAYFVQNIFIFDTLSTHISFFLILGFLNNNFFRRDIYSRDTPVLSEEENAEQKQEPLLIRFSYKKLFFLSGFIILIVFTIYQVNFKPFLSNIYFVKGFRLIGKDCQAASENFQKSFKYQTYLNQELSLVGAQSSFSALERIRSKECKESIFNDLLLFRESLNKATESPNIKYAASLMLLGRLNKNLYLLSDNFQYLEEGEEILLRAVNFKSQAPLVYQSLGEIRMWQGKEKEAIDFYKKALLLNLNMGTLIEFHKKLGMAYREVGEEEKERKELNRALKLSYLNDNPDLYIILRLSDFYIKENDPESSKQLCQEAIRQYNRIIEIIRNRPYLYTSLSTLYLKMGEKEKAKETVKKILEENPHLESAVEKMLDAIGQ